MLYWDDDDDIKSAIGLWKEIHKKKIGGHRTWAPSRGSRGNLKRGGSSIVIVDQDSFDIDVSSIHKAT